MNTYTFVAESNRIEGIFREPTKEETREHERIIYLPYLTVEDIIKFVKVYQPDAKLRDKTGMNVRVGNHIPRLGGMAIAYVLQEIIEKANESIDPFTIHVEYETLHPFTDCNGRSGRVIWAWMMERLYDGYPLGFLHHFYYQGLEASRTK